MSSDRPPLMRDPARGKLAGVCAGIAEYLGMETWVVRLVAVSLVLFTGPTAILAYVLLAWLLDPKSESRHACGRWFDACCGGAGRTRNPVDRERAPVDREAPTGRDASAVYRPSIKEVWQADSGPEDVLRRSAAKRRALEQRLRQLESYVTSSRFRLDREFSAMDRERQ